MQKLQLREGVFPLVQWSQSMQNYYFSKNNGRKVFTIDLPTKPSWFALLGEDFKFFPPYSHPDESKVTAKTCEKQQA